MPAKWRNFFLRDSALNTPVSDMQSATGLLTAYWRGDKRREAFFYSGGILLLSGGIGYNAIQIGLQYAEVASNLYSYHYPDNLEPFALLTESVYKAAGLTVLQAGMNVSRHFISSTLNRKSSGWLREQLTDALLSDSNTAHHVRNYKVINDKGTPENIKNIDQRAIDCTKDVQATIIGLSMGAVTAASALTSGWRELLNISQPVTGAEFLGEWGTATLAFGAASLSVGVGTFVAYKIGKYISEASKNFQEGEATYRGGVSTMMRNAFYIAASAGRFVEKRISRSQYDDANKYWHKNNLVTSGYMGFTNIYNPFSSHIVSYLPALANYVSGNMGMRDYLKTSSTVGSIMNSMEWVIDVMPAIATLRANVNRITDVTKAIHAVHDPKEFYKETGISDFVYRSQSPQFGLSVRNLELLYQGFEDKPFLKVPRLNLRPGDWAQIEAQNGAGKSCFMKAVGGEYLWPYGRGTIAKNENLKIMYAKQDIELQNISLRELLTYPDREGRFADEEIIQVLQDVGLEEKFGAYLDETGKEKDGDGWDRTMSGGEKQKLILARTLLQKPDIIFLDEANSAMDVNAKADFYRLLKDRCQNAIVIAVLHETETPRQKNGISYFNQRLTIKDGMMTQHKSGALPKLASERMPQQTVFSAHVMRQICQSPLIS